MVLVSVVLMVYVIRAEAFPIGPPVFKEDPIQMENGPTNWGGYRGIVVGIGPRSITVDGTGSETHIPPLPPRITRFEGQRYFRAWGPLSWHHPTRGKPFLGHMLSQVRFGDQVRISTGRIDGHLVMYWLRIEQRPGGEVPPRMDWILHPLHWKLLEMEHAKQTRQAKEDAEEQGGGTRK